VRQSGPVKIHRSGFCLCFPAHSSRRHPQFIKTKPPQFQLPTVGSEVFNLSGEVAIDGERLQQEKEAAAKQKLEAEEIEKKQQPNLI